MIAPLKGDWTVHRVEPRIARLWLEHGGNHHGPRVEHITMPMANFSGFVAALSAPAASPAEPSDRAQEDHLKSNRIAMLEEALMPFAAIFAESVRPIAWMGEEREPRPDEQGAWGFNNASISWGDFRRAHAALSTPIGEGLKGSPSRADQSDAQERRSPAGGQAGGGEP